MKLRLITGFLLLFVCVLRPGSVTAQSVNDILGEWNANAPDAPEEYITSVMRITQDSVFTTFEGGIYSFGSKSMSFRNDTLSFEIEGLDVICTLKLEDDGKLAGRAVGADGETRLFLTRKEEQLSNDQ